MKQRSPAWIVALAVLAFVAANISDAVRPGRADDSAMPTAPTIGLGSSAASVLEARGHPVRISYDIEHQVWFYLSENGSSVANYRFNQGLVVKVHGKR